MPLRLTDADYEAHRRCYIDGPTLLAAGVYRVPSIEGRDLVGRKGGGDYAGLVYPCRSLVTGQTVVERLRLDNPPVDAATGKPQHKYLGPPGARNHIYTVVVDPDLLAAQLADRALPIIFGEGEKKCLALFRLARDLAHGFGRPPWLPLVFFGIYGWRGIVGIATGPDGRRVEERGTIPDLDLIDYEGRTVYLCFDSNTATNDMVRIGRAQLARELEGRGAIVWIVDIPLTVTVPSQAAAVPVNGVDDYLGLAGAQPFLDLLRVASRYDWHKQLARSEKGRILPGITNVLHALRLAPAWHGVLGFNEFSLAVEARRRTPWNGPPGLWGDNEDLLASAWLEQKGIKASDLMAGKAVQAVARDHPFHPVRDYLRDLKWDGVPRLDTWLVRYLGAPDDIYTRAIGPCWPVSGVARVMEPGCRVDHTLVLEGPQGAGKSTVFAILGGQFYTDDIPDLHLKDASLATGGCWIVEMPELASTGRSEIEKVKAFLSRATDHVRPPYGRHLVWAPRQCIFGGSVNLRNYLKDETGGRRFWPVECGGIDLEGLRRDRDQLWAEAYARYRKGEKWWLDTMPLIQAAADQQDERYQSDPWEALIEPWLTTQHEITTADVLLHAVRRDSGQWTRGDEIRVGVILNRLGWKVVRREWSGPRRRFYGRPDGAPAAEANNNGSNNGARPADARSRAAADGRKEDR